MAEVTLPFNGSVSAGSQLTLVSKRLNFPFTVKKLIASFALGTDRTLEISYFLSRDNSAPTTTKPSGLNLLSLYGEDTFLTGDDDKKEFPHSVDMPESGSYIKVHANNTDTFTHTIDAQVIIEPNHAS